MAPTWPFTLQIHLSWSCTWSLHDDGPGGRLRLKNLTRDAIAEDVWDAIAVHVYAIYDWIGHGHGCSLLNRLTWC
jgi:hypothetical protein